MHILSSVLLLLSVIQSTSCIKSGYCSQQADCTGCVDTRQWFSKCRWCPLTDTCHHPFSVSNDCSSSISLDISRPCQCNGRGEEPEDRPSHEYNTTMAELMAKWSSLAYVPPWNADMLSLKELIGNETQSQYELVEIVTSDCDLLLDYGPCSALVAISHSEQHMVLAFSGTGSPVQLVEEFVFGFTGMVDFEATGGKILRYNARVHHSLYSCLKDIIEEVNRNHSTHNSTLEVILTGHSLGGAQAQLTAVRLIAEGVVNSTDLQVYAFGSPRVGDVDFAINYDKLVTRSWRVVYGADPVPQIVPKRFALQPYAYHTKGEILYKEGISLTANYTVCEGNEDTECSLNEPLCFMCIDSHSYYFLPDIEWYMTDRVQSAAEAGPTASRMHCKAYVLT